MLIIILEILVNPLKFIFIYMVKVKFGNLFELKK